jgi:predicted ATP-grasp superfamily ATP-dependent carboligase
MKNILITYARSPIALNLARHFHAAGHSVYIADSWKFPPSRFSKAIKKCLYVKGPSKDAIGFQNTILDIITRYKIDMVIPLFEETLYLAHIRHLFPAHCQLFAPSFDLLKTLHNKWLMTLKLQELGVDTPPTLLVSKPDDLNCLKDNSGYALKACYSRGSAAIRRWMPHTPFPDISITPGNPWIAQKWLEGDSFCTYSVCQNGNLLAHATYPVGYTAQGKGCIVFESIHHQPSLHWIQKLVKKLNYTGQISFDFIETADKKLYALECNPRATLGALLFHKGTHLDKAFLEGGDTLITPDEATIRQFGIGMLLYGWRANSCPNNSLKKFIKKFSTTRDAIFERNDLKPFFLQLLPMIEVGLKSSLTGLSPPLLYINDYAWNGEESAETRYSLQNT